MAIDERLDELGLILPKSPKLPDGHVTTFRWVRVVGDRVLVSGHGPQHPDGSPVVISAELHLAAGTAFRPD